MKTKWLVLMGMILYISCQKENIKTMDDKNHLTASDYFPLAVGNYWIFENYRIDEKSGKETKLPQVDSITITGDTLINSVQYYVLEGTNYPMQPNERTVLDVLRDSAGYLVNINGTKLFSPSNFTDTLHTQTEVIDSVVLYSLSYVMEQPEKLVRIPAGDYSVLNYKGILITTDKISEVDNPRYLNNYYAQDVGRIMQTFYYLSNPLRYEKRLLRYEIKQ